jgi:phospholipid/cholesterol/gamma-HCH transport system substrate-binding protein
MARESGLELKVGLFVITAIACLVVFIFSISDFSVFKKGWTCNASFHFANGLKKNAPVRVAGVDAGHVRSIMVAYDVISHEPNVLIEVWLDGGMRLPDDSRFLINQLGILGEKYLEIMPGASSVLIAPGAVIVGEDPVAMDAITKTIAMAGTKLNTTLDSINNGILSDANKQSLAVTLANIAAISEGIKMGEGTIGKFLTDKSVYENLDELSADLKANPWKLFYRPKGKK